MSPALITAIAGLVSAVSVLVGVIRHVNGPAHKPPAAKSLPPVRPPRPPAT
jgi:hypothetical protein